MDRAAFLKSTNANRRTYTQFTPSQIDRLDLPNPYQLPDAKVGNFPTTSYPVQLSRSRIFDGVEPVRTQGDIFTQVRGVLGQRDVSRAFDGVGGAAGILGAASLAAPALIPAAAAAGVAYGVYKLGNTFNLW